MNRIIGMVISGVVAIWEFKILGIIIAVILFLLGSSLIQLSITGKSFLGEKE